MQLVAGLCGCKKIVINRLEGTWYEQYDPTGFAMDDSVEFTFDGNNHYQLRGYDALSVVSYNYGGTYAIDLFGKGTITIISDLPFYSEITYTLVKLTSKEMVWQREGKHISWGRGDLTTGTSLEGQVVFV